MAVYKGVVPSGKYTFNAAAKTITFDADYSGLALSDIMLITNVKSGTAITIYDPFDSAKGGTLATLTLTLNYNTAAMSNSDPLQIIVGMTNLPAALPTDAATETTLSALNTKVPSNLTVTSTRLLVDGSGVTQPISGTITANAGTGTMNVSVQNASLAVTGPLTDTQLRANAVPVSLASLPSLASGSNTIGSIANTSFASTQSGTWNINNVSGTISLPTGAATESTLSTLNGKVPSGLTVTSTRLLVDGSGVTQPVSGTVTANISGSISNTAFEVNNGSGASAVNIQDGGNSITVDGTVTANAGTGNFTVVQPTAANLNATVTGTVAATQSGTWNIGTVTSITNAVTVSQSTATSLKTQAESYQGGSAVSISNPLYVAQIPATSGGVIPASGTSVGGATAITLYSSPSQVYGWYFYNPNGNAAYIHFYDTGSTPTVGGSSYYILAIPPLSGANVFGVGITHTNSIKIGISQGRAVSTPMTNPVDYTIFYK